jgi:hypothetical protein
VSAPFCVLRTNWQREPGPRGSGFRTSAASLSDQPANAKSTRTAAAIVKKEETSERPSMN